MDSWDALHNRSIEVLDKQWDDVEVFLRRCVAEFKEHLRTGRALRSIELPIPAELRTYFLLRRKRIDACLHNDYRLHCEFAQKSITLAYWLQQPTFADQT